MCRGSKFKNTIVPLTNNIGQNKRKPKKNVAAYKQYSSGGSKEVKKGKSALQVSKHSIKNTLL
jgi:hypothetical protein